MRPLRPLNTVNRVDQLYDESYKVKLATIRVPSRLVEHVKNGGSIDEQPMGAWVFSVTDFRKPFQGIAAVKMAPTTRPRVLCHSADLEMLLGLIYPWEARSQYREERYEIVRRIETGMLDFAMTLDVIRPPPTSNRWEEMPFGWRPTPPPKWRRA